MNQLQWQLPVPEHSTDKTQSEALQEVLHLITKPIRDTEPIHTLFSYPAKFQANVPQVILRYFTDPEDVILDPFGGGGTTSAACRLMGRSSIHFDLNPISCLAALAKTTFCSTTDLEHVVRELNKESKKQVREMLLTEEEKHLFGKNVSQTAEHIWQTILFTKKQNNPGAAILACLLIKFLKLCGRRDAVDRRSRPLKAHLNWFTKEFSQYGQAIGTLQLKTKHKIVCASNHSTAIRGGSVSLIITSPPYPGVDVEYNEIQIQRRDLHRCFRSQVGVRIANAFFPGNPEKRELCDGGKPGIFNYFSNAKESLREMRRVLKRGGFAFIYCGFKTTIDRHRYERILKECDFKIVERGTVKLSDDRVASSRSTHHGKDTKMMKQDFLYIVR